jgi:predicted ATPase
LFNVLRGLWGFHIVRAELSTARELGEQCLDLAKQQKAPALSLWAQYVLGMSLFHLGEFDRAREHLEEGFALYDPERGRGHRALQDPGVACLCYLGLTLWFLGYADRALARCTEALALARKLSHPFSQAYALSLAGVIRQFRREVAETAEHAEAAVVLSIDQSIPYWLAWGNVLRGRTLVEAGDAHRAIAEIRAGLQVFEKTGAQLARPLFLGFLAEAYASDGRIAEGQSTLRLALDEVSRTGERFYEAELVRLQGELMLRTDETAQAAEESFERSAAIARAQNAKALELRAVTSLSRLWRKQGKAAQARSRMDELRSWFREGTDTKDLKEAAAILD